MRIKAATFNLKHDHITLLRTHWSKRRESVCEFFAEQEPDLVGTQELTVETLADMEEMLPDYQWVGEGRYGGKKGEFTAIFYRSNKLTCTDSGTFWLAKQEDQAGVRGWFAAFPRTCTWASFRTTSGAELMVFNTHLDCVSPIARRKGLQLIASHMEQHHDQMPMLLTGDFNATPGSGAIKGLAAMNIRHGLFSGNSYNAFINVEGGACRTYHGFKGKTIGKPVDYIFTSKKVRIEDVYIVNRKFAGVYPSDHFPIVMELSFAEGEKDADQGEKSGFEQSVNL